MGHSPHSWGKGQAEEKVGTHAYALSAGLRPAGIAGVCQMRDESMTIAAANGSWRDTPFFGNANRPETSEM